MNKRLLLGMTFALSLGAVPASAFAQAAAESVLLNGASATATTKFGSTLGSALNQASKQMAGRVPQTVQPAPRTASPAGSRPVSKSPVQGTAAGAPPAQGPMIASIQGGATRCAPTNQTASTPENKAATGSTQTNCNGQSSATNSASEKHKSVITLSLQK